MTTTLLEDIRYGFRTLRHAPGFTAVTLLTLALGIGANTALFSVVNGVLLNPLPYPQPEQLVAIHESKANFEQGSISFPNFVDWSKDNHAFSSMAIARSYGFTLSGRGEAEQVTGELISGDFFRLLGVKPVIGRGFTPEEDQFGRAPVALISAAFWQRKFGASVDVVGQSITLSGKDYTVLGVIPASFDLLTPSFSIADVYVPITQWSNPLLVNRNAGLGIHGFGRLKPGVSIEQARADMQLVTRRLAAAYPQEDTGIGATLIPLKQQMTGAVRPFLLLLLAAVGFVLLIACVNVANLMLARSTARMREFGVRVALGASRGRIVRQCLTESVVLAAGGGVLGLLFAAWGTQAAMSALPSALPRAQEIGLDGRVLTFTMVISLLAGVFFGLGPSLRAAASGLHETLKAGGRGLSSGRHLAQRTFVVVEIALAMVLLTGAGLMTRSLARLWSVDPGFNPRNVLSFGLTLSPSMNDASPDAIRAYFLQFIRNITSIPGVQAASLSWGASPMNGDDERLFWIEGQPKPSSDNEMNWTIEYIVEPDYLQALQIPLLRGRFFSPQDNERSPLVVVVDDVFANKFFPHQEALGKRIHLKDYAVPAEIVGVVGHVKQWGLDTDDKQALRAEAYLAFRQLPDSIMKLVPRGTGVVVRSRAKSPELFDSIRRVNGQMSAQQVVYGAQTMEQVISASLATRRLSMFLLAAFAVVALALAAIGIFGVTSYVIGQRTREIAIRMALGAQRRIILRLVLGYGGVLAVIGIASGLALALGLAPLMRSLLYGIAPTDPVTFVSLPLVLGAIALAACYLPARRATRVDPISALRIE